jgi:hypothetical protein
VVVVLLSLDPFSFICWAYLSFVNTVGTSLSPKYHCRAASQHPTLVPALALVVAIKCTGPSSTTRTRHSHTTGASLNTAAPSLATRTTHIETPSTYESPHICGYVQFESCEKGFSDSCITLVLNIIQIIDIPAPATRSVFGTLI